MKKLCIIFTCIIAMAFNVDAQVNIFKIKQSGINYVKANLKAPSTFILTDGLGNKIPVNKVHTEFVNRNDTVYGNVFYKNGQEYLGKIDGADSVISYKQIFIPYYKVIFNYEAQNSYGGMVGNKAFVYVTKKYEVYDEPPFKLIGIKKFDFIRAIARYEAEEAEEIARKIRLESEKKAKKIAAEAKEKLGIDIQSVKFY